MRQNNVKIHSKFYDIKIYNSVSSFKIQLKTKIFGLSKQKKILPLRTQPNFGHQNKPQVPKTCEMTKCLTLTWSVFSPSPRILSHPLAYIANTLIIFLAFGYVTHSFFIHFGISNFNWVLKISKKCLFAYFAFFNGAFLEMFKLSMILLFVLDTFTPEQKLLSVSISMMSILIEN